MSITIEGHMSIFFLSVKDKAQVNTSLLRFVHPLICSGLFSAKSYTSYRQLLNIYIFEIN
jgi:hypothetical protein